MNQVRAYIGLGSNLSEPKQQVLQAFVALDSLPGTQLVSRSSLYRSAPMGPADQPDYINAVVALGTTLEPEVLLVQLQQIETRQGRKRQGDHWGPRTLDLDLLLFDDLQLKTPDLQIPHPGLHQRSFVLYPLAEIAPDLELPALGSLQRLLKACPRGELIKLDGTE